MFDSHIGSLILLFALRLKGSLKSFLANTFSFIMQVIMTRIRDSGYLEYGCTHYRRRCRIRAPCCNEIFDCRHCHNESKKNLDPDKGGHSIPRHQIPQVIYALCNTEQEVQQVCINCGVSMGRYFCKICKLFDDDPSKKHFHCIGCGICRFQSSAMIVASSQ